MVTTMADKDCSHEHASTTTHDITIHDEIVTYERTRCQVCGQVVANVIIHRRPKL